MSRNGRYNHYSVYVDDNTDKWIKEKMEEYNIKERSRFLLMCVNSVRADWDRFKQGKEI